MTLTQPIHALKRRARLLARELGIPLHAALDRVARDEGFRTWSHLSARTSTPHAPATHAAATDTSALHTSSPHDARALFTQLEPGDLILLAARPRQGKTVLGLELAVEALKAGRAASVFSLESTEDGVRAWFARTDCDPGTVRNRLRIDTSDDITAAHIIRELSAAARGTLVVVDYLQLLDRRRREPELGAQLASLRAFTRERGLITVCLSQINRAFERSARTVPTLADVHQPNPLDLGLFTKGCFLHDGQMRLDRWNQQ